MMERFYLKALSGVFALCLLSNPAAGAEPAHVDGEMDSFLSITTSPSFATVNDAAIQASRGDRFPLLQKNQHHYIVLVRQTGGETHLCAFPRTARRGEGTAWATKDHQLVMAKNVKSEKGQLYFRKGQELRIASETPDHWLVEIEFKKKRATFEVPRNLKGATVVYREREPAPVQPAVTAHKEEAPTAGRPAPSKSPYQIYGYDPDAKSTMHRPRKIDEDRTIIDGKTATTVDITFAAPEAPEEEASGEEPPAPGSDPVVEIASHDEKTPPAESTVTDEPDTEQADASEPSEQEPTPPALLAELEPTQAEPFQVEPVAETVAATAAAPSAAPLPTPAPVGFWERYQLQIAIVLLLVAAEVGIYFYLRRRPGVVLVRRRKRDVLVSFDNAKPISAGKDSRKKEEHVFQGSLEGLPMAELVQFLLSSKETGTLTIAGTGLGSSSQVYFQDGEIVDACNGAADGHEALRGVFALKEGTFSFAKGAPPNRARAIEESTMSLLLNALKDVDEGADQKPVVAKPHALVAAKYDPEAATAPALKPEPATKEEKPPRERSAAAKDLPEMPEVPARKAEPASVTEPAASKTPLAERKPEPEEASAPAPEPATETAGEADAPLPIDPRRFAFHKNDTAKQPASESTPADAPHDPTPASAPEPSTERKSKLRLKKAG